MTRSHKVNDKDHAGLAEGTVLPHEQIPKFFGKNGMPGVDPNKIKKNGAGKGNWGTIGDEVADQVADQAFHLSYARRRSNSSGYSTNLNDFKTKFEVNDVEPVFEESIHGPEVTDEDEGILTKTESSSSAGSSVDGKDHK